VGVVYGCLRFLVGWPVPSRTSKVENRIRKSLDHLILMAFRILIAFRTIKVNDQLSFEHVSLPGLNSQSPVPKAKKRGLDSRTVSWVGPRVLLYA
jgi:hypothetical protein